MSQAINVVETLARPLAERQVADELVAEFIRHLQAGARKQGISPAMYLMAPGNRSELGVASSEGVIESLTVRGLSQMEECPVVSAPIRFVEEMVLPRDQIGEVVMTGWDLTPGIVTQPIMAETSNWEVGGMEPIRVSVPRLTANRPVPTTNRGVREVSAREVTGYTGLTEVQFEIQPILGKAQAITHGCLAAIPVVLPRWNVDPLTQGSDFELANISRPTRDQSTRDPMLLRINSGKLAARLGGSWGDMVEQMVGQINGLSGQAVHFAVQALAEARAVWYLDAHLKGQKSWFDPLMGKRIGMLYSSARLAMAAYEALVNQAIAWSQVGVNVLSPGEYAFAAEATGSFFDGASEAGEFMAHDTGRLVGVLGRLRSDLVSLGWRGK